MMENSKFKMLYVKYAIKTPLIFYLFIFGGVCLFIYLTLTVRLDVLKSFPAKCESNSVIVYSDISEIECQKLYLYRNRNAKVVVVRVENMTIVDDGVTIFTVLAQDIPLLSEVSGDITAEVATYSESLLKRIFVKAGRQG